MLFGTAMAGVLVAVLGATGPAKGVTKEQLEYSKTLFAEGEKAMSKGDYATAMAKYHEGYRYAPHLHLFNYNIAAAADAMGDCKTARTYYQRFVDLVAEHPERKKVKAKLKAYGNTCLADADTSEVAKAEPTKKRKDDRKEAEADRAMNEALFQLRVARALYVDGRSKFKKKTKVYNIAAIRKKWNARRMAKLLPKHGVDEDDREVPEPQMPSEAGDACRIAKVQENRTIRALEEARDKWESQESYRVLSRFLRGAERDLEKFKGCS